MKQALKTLLAEGKTAQALAELRKLSLTDSDLSHSIIQISARFAEMERQQHAGTLAQEALVWVWFYNCSVLYHQKFDTKPLFKI